MTKPSDREKVLKVFMISNKKATLEQLKEAFHTDARMTVFRTLRSVGYISSYSHRGAYCTLPQIPDYDELGLWHHEPAHFSRFGSLLETSRVLVETSPEGYTSAELTKALHVEAKHALLKLSREGAVNRIKICRRFVYMGSEKCRMQKQRLNREENRIFREISIGLEAKVPPDEVKTAVILFYSMLNEKQRRLYAGLEAAKFGYGGDRKIADFLGLDVHTVSKGRKELFEDSVDSEGIRKKRAGRKPAEKKRRA